MIKLYPPTKSGSKEMFDDFEKGDFERKEKLENAQDDSVELEVEAGLEENQKDWEKEQEYQNEKADAKEEKLEGKAREDTANEEFSIQQQEDEAKWGPDNIERN